jgi:ABC-type antimicrobial peptide transport system permease subunit
MMLRVMGALAIAAMLISAIGLYGLISHSVARRTREFGVRLALGAAASSIFALVLGEGLKLTAAGAVFGFAGALLALRAMRSLLFGVSPIDPITLAAVVGVTCVVAIVAAYLPARRATLVDPMRSLRQE